MVNFENPEEVRIYEGTNNWRCWIYRQPYFPIYASCWVKLRDALECFSMEILLTGGAGFIGSHLTDRLVADGLVAVEAIANRVPVILSDIFDFRRFNLPDRFYATTLSEFVDKIHFYKESIDNLIVPTINRVALLQDRTPEVVGDAWEYVFNEKGVTQ
jgi:hypothetical protein